MRLLVLAGGFGTRLKSVVAEVPKALAPVGGKPFLHLQIAHWKEQGLRHFTFLLHHQANLIVDFLESERSGLLADCKVEWVVEPAPMDTGGALAYAIEQLAITGDFLVVNADTWLGGGMRALWQAKAPAMGVVKVQDAARYGNVKFDDEYRITEFCEKDASTGEGWINAGLCHLHADSFKIWNHQPFSLEKDRFRSWAAQGIMTAVPLEMSFIDIGIPDDYFRLCRWVDCQKTGKL